MSKQLKKIETPYTLHIEDTTVRVFKEKKLAAITVAGIVSALEAIFVIENMTKKDWLIYEDEKVFLVDRAEWEIAEDRESLI